METYTKPKNLVENPHYQYQRQQTLAGISAEMIDAPIIDLINGFNALPYCFTIQCCYGHFIHLCCAEWFWKRQVNSYALQVQPGRFKHKDSAVLGYREARHVENIRNKFFGQLHDLWQHQQDRASSR